MSELPEGIPMAPQINYDLEDLNQILLEKNPAKYLEVLNYLSVHYPRETIRSILDEPQEESWFSNHVLALARLVGKHGEVNSGRFFYGCDLPEGISEELGIQILDKMMGLGANIWARDYYGDPINVIFDSQLLGYRVENDHFKVKVREYYNRN